MPKDIGSIFPIYGQPACAEYAIDSLSSLLLRDNDSIRFFSLCREALYLIATQFKNNRKVLLPSYTCQTVIDPFEQLGYEISFFRIDEDLRIDTESLIALFETKKPQLIVVHPYYGMDLNNVEQSALEELSRAGASVVVDLTQCLFSQMRLDSVSYYVGSIRKWFGIPDGGFLIDKGKASALNEPERENVAFVAYQLESMRLRGQYFLTGDEEIKLQSRRVQSLANDVTTNPIVPHRMSEYTYRTLQIENIEQSKLQRFNNYSFLFNTLKDNPIRGVRPILTKMMDLTTSPLYFPIYAEDRKKVQSDLADAHIYAPVLWPIEDERILGVKSAARLYRDLLALPCDQRYDTCDMERIIHVLSRMK